MPRVSLLYLSEDDTFPWATGPKITVSYGVTDWWGKLYTFHARLRNYEPKNLTWSHIKNIPPMRPSQHDKSRLTRRNTGLALLHRLTSFILQLSRCLHVCVCVCSCIFLVIFNSWLIKLGQTLVKCKSKDWETLTGSPAGPSFPAGPSGPVKPCREGIRAIILPFIYSL